MRPVRSPDTAGFCEEQKLQLALSAPNHLQLLSAIFDDNMTNTHNPVQFINQQGLLCKNATTHDSLKTAAR
jgi:hypothetical protein